MSAMVGASCSSTTYSSTCPLRAKVAPGAASEAIGRIVLVGELEPAVSGADLIGGGARLECGDVLYSGGKSHAGDDIHPAVSGNPRSQGAPLSPGAEPIVFYIDGIMWE